MNARTAFLGFLFGALVVTSLLAATPSPALAQDCHDVTGGPIPCPDNDGGNKRKTPTPVPPTATWTPTETFTPTASQTPTRTPTASPIPATVQMCLEPILFQKCLGNPQCQGIPMCTLTPGPAPTWTATPVPKTPSLPPSNLLGILTVLGALLGGGIIAAHTGLFERWASAGDQTSVNGDNDNLAEPWEDSHWVDGNNEGQLGGDKGVNTSDPPEDSQPLK